MPGPVTRALQRSFFDCVGGNDPAHAAWLTYVAKA